MESDQVNPHGYAYHPGLSTSVASWLQDQEAHHEPADDDCDDAHYDYPHDALFRPAYAPSDHDLALLQSQHIPSDMAIPTRQRQVTSNGARPPNKSTPRSASNPPTSASVAPTATSAATRASPQAANKVKALAERFEHSPGRNTAVTSPATSSRSRDPARTASTEPAKRANASQTSPCFCCPSQQRGFVWLIQVQQPQAA